MRKFKYTYLLVFLFIIVGVFIFVRQMSINLGYRINQSINQNAEKELFYKELIIRYTYAIPDFFNLRDTTFRFLFKNNDLNHCLIYRFDLNMCQSCLVDDISRLKKINSKILDKNLFVLISCENTRSNNIAIRSLLNGLKYYIVSSDRMKLPITNGTCTRYFGLLDSTGKFLSFYLPDITLPDLTDYYLGEVSKEILR